MSKYSYRYLFFLLLSTILFPVACFGEKAVSGSLGDDDELSRLLAVLDEQTEIATKTKLNADFVPGIVTILRGKELETRGIRNVWEALALVPGVELGMEETGRRHILIRGVGLTYASETAKIMVNNVSYNTATFAFSDTVFSIPIEQVERIEVIRGPGSAIYGEFAYSGVINVITYQFGSKLFGKGTSRQDRLAGGVFSFGENSGDSLYGTLSVSGENSGRGGVNSGYDLVYQVNPAWSNSPGRTNEVTQTRSLLLDIGYQDYTAKLAWLSNGFGDYFGINGDLPPSSGIVTTDRFSTVEVSRRFTTSDSLTGNISVGQRVFSERKNDLYVDNVNYWCDGLCDPSLVPVDNVIADLSSRERARYLTADMHWRPTSNDTLYMEALYSDVELVDATMLLNLDPTTYIPTPAMQNWSAANPLVPGMSRHIFSSTLQNEHRFAEGVLVTAGVRYDNYSDVGDRVTPRLAGVWSISGNHLLKAQFSQAFRPPTFYELGGAVGGTLEPSTVDTYELGYIARGIDSVARVTGYYSRMEKMVTFASSGYSAGDISLRGVELEYEQQISRELRMDGNVSLLTAYDNYMASDMAHAANRLANVGVSYSFSPALLVNTQYRYIGPRGREVGDMRGDLASCQTVDITASLLNVVANGMTLRGGVRNLLDAAITYPAPPDTYPGDYPRPSRYWWVGIQYTY